MVFGFLDFWIYCFYCFKKIKECIVNDCVLGNNFLRADILCGWVKSYSQCTIFFLNFSTMGNNLVR